LLLGNLGQPASCADRRSLCLRQIAAQGWTQAHLRDFDHALIVLDQDVGSRTGWLGYGWGAHAAANLLGARPSRR
jgi:dienelactone hydrolase